jgi:hypothetical protein
VEKAQKRGSRRLSRALANARLNVRQERRESALVVLIALAWQPIEPERYLALASAGDCQSRRSELRAQSRHPRTAHFGAAPRPQNSGLKMIDGGERREDVAALLNVNRTTLYRALAV